MKLKQAAVSLITSCSMLLGTAGVIPSATPATAAISASLCVVDPSTSYQSIRGFGGINLPDWISQGDLTDAQRQKAFGNGADELGLTVLRIYASDDSNAWSRAVPTAKFAQKMGATVFATPWNPPSSIRENGGGGFQTGKYHLPSWNYGKYAQHLNDYNKYMKSQGVDLYAISIQNEPDYSKEWTGWTSDETTSFLANYGDQLDFRVMSPETFQYTNKDYYTKILNNSKAFANTDLFGTHFYGTQPSQMDFPALENCGKEIWMTEVYVPNSDADSANKWPDALDVSRNIHNGLVKGNLSAYVWWYIRRSYGLMTEDGKISKRGYCMAQYSKFVRPGDIRINCTENPASEVYVSAYKNDNKQITIVAVNNNDEGYAQEFSVGSGVKNIDRYRTSQNENLALTQNLENSDGKFFAQLPAKSVSTFVVTYDGSIPVDNPGQEIEPDSNGYYFHDTFEDSTDDWNPHGSTNQIAELSGRAPYQGTNALLIRERESAWNGLEKSLNSAAFKSGTEYSFSVCAQCLDSEQNPQTFKLSLQYTNSEGKTSFANIATATTANGNYVQLANTNFKLPEGSEYVIYVETDSGTDNFYIDEAIGAVAGTQISGPGPVEAPTTTTAPPTTTQPAVNVIQGDLNSDSKVNIFDLITLRKALVNNTFANANAEKAADVNGDGSFSVADLTLLNEFLLGTVDSFPAPVQQETKTLTMSEYTAKVESDLVNVEPSDSHQEKSGVQYGTIQSGTYYSTTCKRNKAYNVLLPANYSTNKKYPVLYCMHGYWEDQNRMINTSSNNMATKQIVGNAIAEGSAEEMIVVFPYIYSSATQASCSGMDETNNQAYDNFINDLTVDLMPYIEKTYSVKTGRDNTAITGFSMGGRESLLIGMKRPDLFGYVGAICPAPGVTGSFKWNSDEEAPHLLFITGGSNDTVVYNNPETYHNNFAKNSVPHIWHYVQGGAHGDNSIHAHLYNFVRDIFKA